MITHYDMSTGEWISGDEAEPAARTDARCLPPAPTPRLIQANENVETIPLKQGLPADIATLQISVMLAKWG